MAKKTLPDKPVPPKEDGAWVEIKLSGRLQQQLERPSPSPEAAQRRQDTETGRRAAQEFAMEALHKQVHIMRHSPDEALQLKAAQAIQDRAWGKAKPLTEEEKKGEDAATILDMLAAISAGQTRIERERHEVKQIEAERLDEAEQTYFDADSILDDAAQVVPRRVPRDDDEEGALIDG